VDTPVKNSTGSLANHGEFVVQIIGATSANVEKFLDCCVMYRDRTRIGRYASRISGCQTSAFLLATNATVRWCDRAVDFNRINQMELT